MLTIDPNSYPPLEPALETALLERINEAPYSKLLGMVTETVRREYSRMRLPYRPDLNQPAGLVHGGAIASLIDTAVVGAVFSGVQEMPRRIVTINMLVQYMDAVIEEDVIAHAWVRKRGRSTVFLSVECETPSGKQVCHGELVYRIVY
jgi:uncharacterized protein (TIGR00369 family)